MKSWGRTSDMMSALGSRGDDCAVSTCPITSGLHLRSRSPSLPPLGLTRRWDKPQRRPGADVRVGSKSVTRRCRLDVRFARRRTDESLRQIDPLNPLFPHPSRSTGVARVADDAAEPLVLGKQVFLQATRHELIEQL